MYIAGSHVAPSGGGSATVVKLIREVRAVMSRLWTPLSGQLPLLRNLETHPPSESKRVPIWARY